MTTQEWGKWFGYPQCCIDEFESNLNNKERPDEFRRTVGKGTGFVPCTAHAHQIESGEITLESLISDRKNQEPFFSSPPTRSIMDIIGKEAIDSMLVSMKKQQKSSSVAYKLSIRGARIKVKKRLQNS